MPTLLEVSDLKKHFPVRGGLLRRVVAQVRAVDGGIPIPVLGPVAPGELEMAVSAGADVSVCGKRR